MSFADHDEYTELRQIILIFVPSKSKPYFESFKGSAIWLRPHYHNLACILCHHFCLLLRHSRSFNETIWNFANCLRIPYIHRNSSFKTLWGSFQSTLTCTQCTAFQDTMTSCQSATDYLLSLSTIHRAGPFLNNLHHCIAKVPSKSCRLLCHDSMSLLSIYTLGLHRALKPS